MEAREYVTNEEGERVGVFVDLDRYQDAKKELAEIRTKLEENEALLLQLLEVARRLPNADYEDFLTRLRDRGLTEGRTPEQIERRLEMLEDYEALLASTDDAESEDDWEEAVPLRSALERIDASREVSGRSGEV